MLRSATELHGYGLDASDGSIGKLKDFLFDDREWDVRHAVADIGSWLAGKYVLLPPDALGQPDRDEKSIAVAMTRAGIQDAPDLSADPPVSTSRDALLIEAARWAPGAPPGTEDYRLVLPNEFDVRPETDPHLRSVAELGGYLLETHDHPVGRVADMIVDTDAWSIRYVAVDVGDWMQGKKVLLSPRWILEVDWPGRMLRVDMSRKQVEDSPEYDPSEPVNVEVEKRVYDYHGRYRHTKDH